MTLLDFTPENLFNAIKKKIYLQNIYKICLFNNIHKVLKEKSHLKIYIYNNRMKCIKKN